jgi:hypothetical protein
MEAVVGAMRAGWRRPGRNGGLDGDLVRRALSSPLLADDSQCSCFARSPGPVAAAHVCNSSCGAGVLRVCASTGAGCQGNV